MLGIDVGTTSLKSAIFDLDGKMCGVASEEYNLLVTEPNRVELGAETYWGCCVKAIRQLLSGTHVDPAMIRGIAVSSQGETLIPVDKDGVPCRRAIVWLDNRSGEEARSISEHFGVDGVYGITGQPEVIPTWPATKILWMRGEEPDLFKRTHRFMLVEDYITYKLTDQFATEPSVMSSSLLLNIRQLKWWPEMLNFLGISEDNLPQLKGSGEEVGATSEKACRETGLNRNTVVCTGAMDQAAACVGAGNIRSEIISENTGGALAVCATTDRPVFDKARRIPCHVHAAHGLYLPIPWCVTAGMALRWFRDKFCSEEMEAAKRAGIDPYDVITVEAERVKPGSDGLIMLPHLAGAGCPEFNPNARGVFFGFGLGHTKAHFIRAVLESVAYMLRRNIEILEQLGIGAKQIRSMGGGAKSGLWNQIKSDCLGKPLVTLACGEAASLGVAINAAVGLGFFPSLEEACDRMVHIHQQYHPDREKERIYSDGYRRYLKLYEALYAHDLF